MNLPSHLHNPLRQYASEFAARAEEGRIRMQHAKIVFVGLARNCGQRLSENFGRLLSLVDGCREWALHIESNDCDDNTLDVLHDFAGRHKQATYHYAMLGRRHYTAEFAGPRTIAMAEYRDACQRWVRACHADADYVVVIDWDQWGGWSEVGVHNGIGWLVELPAAYGMASVSLSQHPALVMKTKETAAIESQWMHYDAWAIRGVGQHGVYWDDYTHGQGGWKHQWIPPVGSSPVLVSSAFGGLCIYRADAYFAGTYDGITDCEHVPFHASIARQTGRHLYINPSQRCVMHWMEPSNAGQHGDD